MSGRKCGDWEGGSFIRRLEDGEAPRLDFFGVRLYGNLCAQDVVHLLVRLSNAARTSLDRILTRVFTLSIFFIIFNTTLTKFFIFHSSMVPTNHPPKTPAPHEIPLGWRLELGMRSQAEAVLL